MIDNAFAAVALRQVEKSQPVLRKDNKKAVQEDTPMLCSSLEDLVRSFEDELYISFETEDRETYNFRIKVVDPGILFLETGIPIHLKATTDASPQNQKKLKDYYDNMSEKERANLIQAEINHKYRVLTQCVLEPRLCLNEAEGGFPISNLPAEIITGLYETIMDSIQQSEDFLAAFQQKAEQKDAKESLFLIYEMGRRFSIRPYQFLFPSLTNPHTQLSIDLIVFQIGYKREKEERADELRLMAGVSAMKSAFTRG